MVYLVHAKIKYSDSYFGCSNLYYRFESLNTAISLIEHLKYAMVPALSDDVKIKITIEALTKEEYDKMIEETKGE